MRLAVTGYAQDAGHFAGTGGYDFVFLLGGSGITRPRTDREALIGGFRELPFGLLHVDGQYDDFDYLGGHPARPWNGGLAQTLSRGIMRLCRGQVFEIAGRTFLTVGGGTAPDRTEEGRYWDWWPEQDISDTEERTLFENLSRYANSVDFILTYDVPTSWRKDGATRCSDVLEELRRTADYGHWFHYGGGRDECFPGRRASAVTCGIRDLPVRPQNNQRPAGRYRTFGTGTCIRPSATRRTSPYSTVPSSVSLGIQETFVESGTPDRSRSEIFEGPVIVPSEDGHPAPLNETSRG